MVDLAKLQEDSGVRRTRKRTQSFKIDKQDVANRVVEFYDHDIGDRIEFMDMRLQRYAKFRLWSERNSLPWDDASDVTLADMMSDSLRMQDTLHNAVIGFDKPVGATAVRKEEIEKVEKVDSLIHHQIFNDMNGEDLIGDLAETFINDGVFTIFIPWVREDREVSDVRTLAPIPDDQTPRQYFQNFVTVGNQGAKIEEENEGWDWTVIKPDSEPEKVSFYTTADFKVEMVTEKVVRVFDGPRPTAMDIDEVLHPWRAQNLQIPGPSNPGGSSHVILIDYPSLDELKRLVKSGFYDQLSMTELEKVLESTVQDRDNQEMKEQKDALQGTIDNDASKPEFTSHNKFTRLRCFDLFDVDDDGIDEDMIWWVIKETKTLLKAKRLTEMYPANPPRRPFAEASLMPVKGRRLGISYLEMIEGLHDTTKEIMDQTIDAGTLASSPFFFYKSTGLTKPESIRTNPGEGYPLADPKNDIHFPQIPNAGQTFGLNMMTILNQHRERLTMVGDLQAGRVPAGKSSALRTSGGIEQLLSQAEARPERILRRFFIGLTEMYAQIHELNQRFLPDNKKIRIIGTKKEGEDPYQTVTKAGDIAGRFQFTFSANVFNATKANLQTALSSIMQVMISPVMLQMGITDQDHIYRLARDFIAAWGQDPHDYSKAPNPEFMKPSIQAEEAITSILNDTMPDGRPFEGAEGHLTILQTFMQSVEFGTLTINQVEIYRRYLEIVSEKAQQEQQRQQQQQAAQQLQSNQTQSQASGAAPPNMDNASLNEGEVLDRSLPSAGQS